MKLLRPSSGHKAANKFLLFSAVTASLLIAAIGGLWIYQNIKAAPPIPPATIQEIMDTERLSIDERRSVVALPDETGLEKSGSQIENRPCPVEQCPDTAAYSELTAKISQLQVNLNRANDALLYFDERLNAIDNLKAQLASVTEAYHSTSRQMSTLSAQLDAKISMDEISKPTLSSVELMPHQSTPPFRLIGIDQWQNQWNAVLELNGQITMIEPNSSRAGWQLMALHPAKQIAVFKSDRGVEAELRVDG